jgi:hypothetical protein
MEKFESGSMCIPKATQARTNSNSANGMRKMLINTRGARVERSLPDSRIAGVIEHSTAIIKSPSESLHTAFGLPLRLTLPPQNVSLSELL